MVRSGNDAGSLSLHPTNLDESRARPTVLSVGVGGGCLSHHFYFLSLCPWEMALYRLYTTQEKQLKKQLTNITYFSKKGGLC